MVQSMSQSEGWWLWCKAWVKAKVDRDPLGGIHRGREYSKTIYIYNINYIHLFQITMAQRMHLQLIRLCLWSLSRPISMAHWKGCHSACHYHWKYASWPLVPRALAPHKAKARRGASWPTLKFLSRKQRYANDFSRPKMCMCSCVLPVWMLPIACNAI